MLTTAMLAVAVSVVSAMPSVEPGASFGHVERFRVRADVHGGAGERSAIKAAVEDQAIAALARSGIPVVRAPRVSPGLDMTGDLVVDVHVASTDGVTAVAWAFHVSQMVVLHTGALSFASTWEVGDLVQGPATTAPQRLTDSLEPALHDFCAAYHAARRASAPEPSASADTPADL